MLLWLGEDSCRHRVCVWKGQIVCLRVYVEHFVCAEWAAAQALCVYIFCWQGAERASPAVFACASQGCHLTLLLRLALRDALCYSYPRYSYARYRMCLCARLSMLVGLALLLMEPH